MRNVVWPASASRSRSPLTSTSALPALGQVEKRLIVCIPAYLDAFFSQLDYVAVWKIFGQQFATFLHGQLKFRISENPC